MLPAAEKHASAIAAAPHAVWSRCATVLTYDHIPAIRQEMADFLQTHGYTPAYTGKLALSLTEILTNLVKHPAQKPLQVDMTLEISPDGIVLDVADDASPFATFDAKCKEALSRLRCTETLAESGYGLGCILSQHARVFYYPQADDRRRNHFVIEDTPDRLAATWIHPPAPRRKPVIFLIDDDAVTLKTQQRMLGEKYDVIAFSSAMEALELYRTQRPDLVISDLHMPGMNGVGLRQALSTLDDGDTVPFIFLSGIESGATSPYISRIGIDDYLSKPVTAEKLNATVERLLTRHGQVRRAIHGKFHQNLDSLLKPAFPAAPQGWRLTTLNSMAAAGGGDFTLWQDTPAHFLGVIADVMGHGKDAKFFAYAYAGYLRSLFRMTARQETGAADFLTALSAAVADDDFLETTLLTCQSFCLFADGRIEIASAGHPAPVLLAASSAGAAQDIDSTGPLPGIAPGSRYRQTVLSVQPGDKVIFGTDGFFSVFDPEGYRRDDLYAPLAACHALSGDKTAAELWQVFETLRQRHPHAADDATLVIAEFGGKP